MKIQIDFTGKHILVIGSAQGVGAGVVSTFIEHGATVSAYGINKESLAQITNTTEKEKLITLSGQNTTAEGCKKIIDMAASSMGGIDILINCTEFRDDKKIADLTPENWSNTMSHLLTSAHFCTQYAAPHLIKSKGAIVNVTSTLGLMGKTGGTSTYSTAAGAIIQLTRMTTLRLGVHNVRANCVCVGEIGKNPTATPDIPIGRTGTQDDIIPTVLFLSSPYTAFMTGSIITNDGGTNSGH